MGVIDIGLTPDEVKDASEFVVVPAATYTCIIESVEGPLAPSAPGKSPLLKFTLAITDSEYAGVKLFYRAPLTKVKGKGANFLQDICDAIGGYNWSGTLFDTDEFVGKTVRAEVGIRTYKEKPQNEITGLSRL